MPAFLKPAGQVAGEALQAGISGFQQGESMLAERQRRDVIKRDQAIREAAEARRADLHDVTKRQAFADLRGTDALNLSRESQANVDQESEADRISAFGLKNDNTKETIRGQRSINSVRERTEDTQVDQASADLAGTRATTRGKQLDNTLDARTLDGKAAAANAGNRFKASRHNEDWLQLPDKAIVERKQIVIDDLNADYNRVITEAKEQGSAADAEIYLAERRRDAMYAVFKAGQYDRSAATDMVKKLDFFFFNDEDVGDVEYEGSTMYVLDNEGNRMMEDPDGPGGEDPKPFAMDGQSFMEKYMTEELPVSSSILETEQKTEIKKAGVSKKTGSGTGSDRTDLSQKQHNDASLAIAKHNDTFFNIGRRSTPVERNFSAFVSEKTTAGIDDPAEVSKRYNTLLEEAMDGDRPFKSKKAERDKRNEYMNAIMEMGSE